MIRPYLNGIINDDKTYGECRIHSDNTITGEFHLTRMEN